jgi:hypothetical protein
VPIGREVGSRGVVSGWRISTIDDARDSDVHVLYLEDAPASAATDAGGAYATGPDGMTRRIWRYPSDPDLPALQAVVFPDAARVVLDRLGVEATITGLSLVAYRPRKRAVVRVTTVAGVLFIKIVPPKLFNGVLERHRAWHDAGMPSPPPVASSPEGLIVLGALVGRPAEEAVHDLDPSTFATAIDDLRMRVGAIRLGVPARPSLGDRLDWYRDRVTGLAPEFGADLDRATATATARRGQAEPHSTTVHGDLHLGQLLTDPLEPARLVGVLDVDTSGFGDPTDDDAALWAHAIVTAERGDAAVGRFAAALQADWMRDSRRRDRIAATATAHLLGHGLSGHVGLERAVSLAIAIAERPDENPLTSVS